jgi:hypothetical protein
MPWAEIKAGRLPAFDTDLEAPTPSSLDYMADGRG